MRVNSLARREIPSGCRPVCSVCHDGSMKNSPIKRVAVAVHGLPVPVRRLLLRTRDGGQSIVGAVAARGSNVYCPLCQSHFSRFRSDEMCWECGSLGRHRALFLLLNQRPEMLKPGMSLLHVAPESALRKLLAEAAGAEYVAGDMDPAHGDIYVDVTHLSFGDNSFDGVICNHVLEHIPRDREAMAEILRVLRPGGWAILLVPVRDRDATLEDPSVTDPLEREKLFEQWDHVRIYGRDYVDRLAEAGFRPEVIEVSRIASAEQQAQMRLGRVEPLFIAWK